MRQYRMGSPQFGEPRGESGERFVGRVPVEPGNRSVLCVGVVVSALRLAEFRAHREHWRAAREHQNGQKRALIA